MSGVEATADGVRLRVASALAGELGEGDSVAVNGVCLTATEVAGGAVHRRRHARDAAPLLARRGGRRHAGQPRAAAARGRTASAATSCRATSTASGAVDAVEADGFARVVTIDAPPELLRYVVEKGSIAVDGVSLTVACVTADTFSVSLIPETLERTNLGAAAPGTPVNLEVDVLAKYVEKLVAVA